MKIQTNVNAGGFHLNHNEKTASDNNGSIEQKKSFGKKLRLSKETVRELKNSELKTAAGGGITTISRHPCTLGLVC